MLRGRIMALNGTDVRDMKVPAEGAWVLHGDRGITYAATRPDNATLTERQVVAEGLFGRAAGLVLGRRGARRWA